MEITNPWHLYLWTRLDTVQNVAVFWSLFVGLCLILWFPLYVDYNSRDWAKRFGKFLIPMHVVTVGFSLLVVLFLPSQKDAAMIYVIPKIANNQMLQKEAGELYQIAREAMISYLPKKAEEKKEE